MKKSILNFWSSDNEGVKLAKITIILLVLFIFFFWLTNTIINKEKDKEIVVDEEEVVIQYKEILVGNVLKQKEDEYYVLVMFVDDAYNSLYVNYLDNNLLPKYLININNSFNKKYINEEEDFNKEKMSFKTVTLLKIKNKQIIESYEGREDVIKYLKG